MRRITNEELLNNHGNKFLELRKNGLTDRECSKILGLGERTTGRLRRLLNINRLQKWQKICMPEKFSERTIGLLYGTLMGDASIHVSGFDGTHKSFALSHSPKQKSYIEHKRNLLHEIVPHKIKTMKDEWGTLRFTSAPHPEFDVIYNDFYSDGEKQITNKVLNRLNPEGIALWFMDDGCLRKGGLSIATCAFNEASINNINKYFHDKYDITFTISESKYLRMDLYGQSAIKFKSLINDFLIPEMRYKVAFSKGIGKGTGYRSTSE